MGIHRRILGLAVAALLAAPGLVHAQSRQVSGTVVRSGSAAPIPEATIAVAGTTSAVRTDAQGKFTITAPQGDIRLSARAIGFTRKDALVPAAKTTVDFILDQGDCVPARMMGVKSFSGSYTAPAPAFSTSGAMEKVFGVNSKV